MTIKKCQLERAEAFCRGFLLMKEKAPDRARMFCRGFLALMFPANGS